MCAGYLAYISFEDALSCRACISFVTYRLEPGMAVLQLCQQYAVTVVVQICFKLKASWP